LKISISLLLRITTKYKTLGPRLQQVKQCKSADVKSLARQYVAELNEDIEKLQSIRDQIEHLSDCCQGNNRPECPILDDLANPVSEGKRQAAA
jgi:hypothetical protein